MSKPAPKVFVSYSHDNLEHKQWVLGLATRLVHSGVDVALDVWSLGPGDDLPTFMERQLTDSDRVIMICTENYVQKANKGTGGVGYEKMIVTSTLLKTIDDNKIIPIIRQNGTKDTPTFLSSKLYIDFSNDHEFETVIDDLLRAIHGEPLYKKPKIGNSPYTLAVKTPPEPAQDIKRDILKTLIEIYEIGETSIPLDYVRQKLGLSRIILEMNLEELESEGFISNNNNNIYLKAKGKGLAIQQGWVK